LKSIWTYTEDRWGRAQAEHYLSDLGRTIEMLVAAPDMGPNRDDIRKGYRSLWREHHVIFYRLAGARVEVVRILHQSIDIPRHLLRLEPTLAYSAGPGNRLVQRALRKRDRDPTHDTLASLPVN